MEKSLPALGKGRKGREGKEREITSHFASLSVNSASLQIFPYAGDLPLDLSSSMFYLVNQRDPLLKKFYSLQKPIWR